MHIDHIIAEYEKRGCKFDIEIEQLMKKELYPNVVKFKYSPTNKFEYGIGKQAATIDDLRKIIQAIPQQNPNKNLWCSVYLFSFYTGSRGFTLCSMDLKDILFVNQENDKIFLTIRVSRCKGKPFCKEYTFSYHILSDDSNELNFVRWLRHYIKQYYTLIYLSMMN